MICPSCKSENPNSNWYCDSCGKALRDRQSPAGNAATAVEAAPESRGAPPESLFADRYCELTRIGDGQMATVYRARDKELGAQVALKVLHPELAGNQSFIKRFRREIALARSITHPNIYRIYDIGQNAGTYFISMEYIEGTELKKLIRKRKVNFDRGIDIAAQIALALQQAHSKDIIHRDLKPQNIMIDRRSGRVVVMDFGIAIGGSLSSALTQTGAFLGTPDYISPEQAEGRKVDLRSDIYSLGVIMYEMFTGSLPFTANNPLAVALSHINQIPPPPRELNPDIPADLEAVILKAINKKPGKRFRDAADLIGSLERLSSAGRQPSVPEPEPTPKSTAAKPEMLNPFLNRKMIRDTRYFFGREKEITTIYSRIGAARPQSVSIVGERRIGKSSLLYYLYKEENLCAHLRDPDTYIVIFIDFQEKRRVSLNEFFTSLFDGLKKHGKNRIPAFPEPGYNGFKQICEELDNRDMKLILLFDEFESITKNKNFDPDFYSFLRSVANNYNVAYVTSSVKNLQELCHNREISDSPFFNIFSNLNLSVFTEQQARDFVRETSARAGHSLEEHFDTVTELAGYFPFYMAIACSILFEFDLKQADPGKTVLENVQEMFLEEARMHFQFIVNSFSPDELRTCRKIMDNKPLQAIDKYIVRDLVKRGYLIADPGNPDEVRLFSKAFTGMLVEKYVKDKKKE